MFFTHGFLTGAVLCGSTNKMQTKSKETLLFIGRYALMWYGVYVTLTYMRSLDLVNNLVAKGAPEV